MSRINAKKMDDLIVSRWEDEGPVPGWESHIIDLWSRVSLYHIACPGLGSWRAESNSPHGRGQDRR